ncbi:MAG TPA: hypothetical protein VE173_09670, partial [Longimicrobiales bacterium]|nr:hypothetical protein [Longimicrobiales bacterium]
AALTAFFLLFSALLVWAAFQVGTDRTTGDLLLNLGTETMGIVLTVTIVDWFFERRRLQARARQLSWGALHQLEHAVWVWQGGPRQLETDELLGILSAVGARDPLPEFTQNLLLSLGTRSKQALKDEPNAVKAIPGLEDAFQQLARLSSIRDGGELPPPRKLADILSSGVSHLAVVLSLPDEYIPARLIRYRDPTVARQEQRHFGVGGQWEGGGREAATAPLL